MKVWNGNDGHKSESKPFDHNEIQLILLLESASPATSKATPAEPAAPAKPAAAEA